jgi:putative tryptophan/tyrosine transport system substrate-binding protein
MQLGILTLMLCLFAGTAPAQPPAKISRIGFLSPYTAEFDAAWRASLRRGFRDLGYVEGANMIIEERHANGTIDKLPQMAEELTRANVDVFVTHGEAAIRAARTAAPTAPIVMCPHPDPVRAGFAASLARPGGNITGLSDSHGDLVGKRLQLLKEVIPSVSRVAVLLDPSSRTQVVQWKELQLAAPALRLTVIPIEIKGPDDIGRGFAMMRQKRIEAVSVLGGAAPAQLHHVAELAAKNGLPTVATTARAAEQGLLISYGADFTDLYRRAATYVDKILRGAKPAELAIEQPVKFEVTVNRRTAKALGLTVPASVVMRADRVID